MRMLSFTKPDPPSPPPALCPLTPVRKRDALRQTSGSWKRRLRSHRSGGVLSTNQCPKMYVAPGVGVRCTAVFCPTAREEHPCVYPVLDPCPMRASLTDGTVILGKHAAVTPSAGSPFLPLHLSFNFYLHHPCLTRSRRVVAEPLLRAQRAQRLGPSRSAVRAALQTLPIPTCRGSERN